MEQLQQVVACTLEKETQRSTSIENVQRAEKYLLKLIPLQNRVALHDMAVYVDTAYSFVVPNSENKETIPNTKIGDIPRLLFSKTKYLFLNSENALSEIIPKNLREFRMFIALLDSMKDPGTDNDSILLFNQQQFKDYFYNVWKTIHLGQEEQKLIEQLHQISDYTMYNKTVVSMLCHKYSTEQPRRFLYERRTELTFTPIELICNNENINYNVSLGDVLSLCSYIESIRTDEHCRIFLFAIKAMYTMRLQDAFQEQLSSTELEKYIDSTKKDERIYFSNYQLLLGGCAINSAYNAFLPSPMQSDWNRLYHESKLEISKTSTKQKCLFDMLTALYSWEDGKKDQKTAYRKRKQAYYKRDLSKAKVVCYDFFAWTYNLPYIHECLRKFLTWDDCVQYKILESIVGETLPENWLRKYAITSVDFIDMIVDSLNRTKFEMSTSEPLSIYNNVFDKIIDCAEKVSKNYGIQEYESPKFMKQLLNEQFVPFVLRESNKKKLQNISCRLSDLKKKKIITPDALWTYVDRKNPGLPKEVKKSLYEYIHSDTCIELQRKRDIDSIVKVVKGFSYEVE